MSLWSLFSWDRSKQPTKSAHQTKDDKEDRGVLCHSRLILRFEKEYELCSDVLSRVSKSHKTIVLLRSQGSIYFQANFKMKGYETSPHCAKARLPGADPRSLPALAKIVSGEDIESVQFVRQRDFEEFSRLPQLVDFIDLFVMADIVNAKAKAQSKPTMSLDEANLYVWTINQLFEVKTAAPAVDMADVLIPLEAIKSALLMRLASADTNWRVSKPAAAAIYVRTGKIVPGVNELEELRRELESDGDDERKVTFVNRLKLQNETVENNMRRLREELVSRGFGPLLSSGDK